MGSTISRQTPSPSLTRASLVDQVQKAKAEAQAKAEAERQTRVAAFREQIPADAAEIRESFSNGMRNRGGDPGLSGRLRAFIPVSIGDIRKWWRTWSRRSVPVSG